MLRLESHFAVVLHTGGMPGAIDATPLDAEERMSMNKHDPSCARLLSMAERELGAFISAVTELYGPEEGRISAEDWVDELESMNGVSGWTIREWRQITIAAAARLTTRLVEVGHQAIQETQ